MNYTERVADRAADIKIVQLLLSLIALPFFLLGVIAAVVWLALRWSYAAVLIGFEQIAATGARAEVDSDAG